MSNAVLELSKQLIDIASLTPFDQGCQKILQQRLQAIGFHTESMPAGKVDNLWAVYGNKGPILAFAGHTDVVPIGNRAHWHSDPFNATVIGDKLHGRGAQDMKGALAAMVIAAEEFIAKQPSFPGRLAMLITSGEEGSDDLDGTPVVMERLHQRGEFIEWCVVGEPSSHTQLGDMIRVGRRGSLKAFLTIKGKQGHVAYPHLANNPIHTASAFLKQLVEEQWCQGNEHFPPTVMQCAHLASNTKTINIIPGELELWLAFRYSSEINHEEIKQRLQALLNAHRLDYDLKWELSGQPFLTKPGKLIDAVVAAIKEETHLQTELSTSGGTSDGRFIAPYGTEVIELGTCNDSIHKVNEAVKVSELQDLQHIYSRIMAKLLLN